MIMSAECSLATLPPLERGVIKTAAIVGAGALALKGAEVAYRHGRLARYTPEQFEAATEPSSIVPYISFALGKAEEYGLEVVLAGGIAKQALADPETVFDVDTKTMTVSDSQSCRARRGATVLRPDEVTERDIDLFCKYLWVGEGDGRERVEADQSNPEIAKVLKQRAKKLQEDIDEYAKSNGLDIGSELSLFGYDAPYGHNFRLLDYATKTKLQPGGKTEILHDNNGNEFEMPVDEQWTLRVGDLIIPVNSPQVQLGRTLNRTTVARERDVQSVNAAIKNLLDKGLWQGDMTNIWYLHQQFRRAMDDALRAQTIANGPGVLRKANLLGMRVLAPFTGMVEGSDLLSAAIRDRRGPVSKIAGYVMNASSGK